MKRFLRMLAIGSIPFILIAVFQILAQNVHYLFNIGTLVIAIGTGLVFIYMIVRAIINAINDRKKVNKE